MTNTDNTYGTFNKRTHLLTQPNDGSTEPTTFATVDEAKSFFYKDAALAVFDECCTELQWALVHPKKLKYTMAFGTKGGNIAEADDWAGQFNSRKIALISAGNWSKHHYMSQELDSHLF